MFHTKISLHSVQQIRSENSWNTTTMRVDTLHYFEQVNSIPHAVAPFFSLYIVVSLAFYFSMVCCRCQFCASYLFLFQLFFYSSHLFVCIILRYRLVCLWKIVYRARHGSISVHMLEFLYTHRAHTAFLIKWINGLPPSVQWIIFIRMDGKKSRNGSIATKCF